MKDHEWFRVEQVTLKHVGRNSTIESMITRAKIDHFVFPAVSGKRVIFFDQAWAVSGNGVYLSFGVVGRADEVVVYRGELQQGRLLWKASSSESP